MQRRWRALGVLGGAALAGGLLAARAGEAQTDEPEHRHAGPRHHRCTGRRLHRRQPRERPDAAPPVDRGHAVPAPGLPAPRAACRRCHGRSSCSPTSPADRPRQPPPTRTDTPPLTHPDPAHAPGLNLSVVAQVQPDTTPATAAAHADALRERPDARPHRSGPPQRAPQRQHPAVDVYANGTEARVQSASGSKSDVLVEAGDSPGDRVRRGREPGLGDAAHRPVTPIDRQAERLEAVYLAGDVDGDNLAAFTRDPSDPEHRQHPARHPRRPVDVYPGRTLADNPPLLTGGLRRARHLPVPGGLVGAYDIQVFAAWTARARTPPIDSTSH